MASREEEEGKHCKENRINKNKEVNKPMSLPGIDKYLIWTIVERGVYPRMNLRAHGNKVYHVQKLGFYKSEKL